MSSHQTICDLVNYRPIEYRKYLDIIRTSKNTNVIAVTSAEAERGFSTINNASLMVREVHNLRLQVTK